jgi:SAM-dependent MidA family methyltransferase
MSLMDRLKAEIGQTGPLTVAQFMARCLHDPEDGYYATRPRLGEAGDFITAPMVSQMFGELIGLWCAETWARLGRPERVLWVEVGPGDGTLMDDALRACRAAAPEFLDAAELWLVETSAPLAETQKARLAGAAPAPRWAARLAELPADAPAILIANEVLDCLPARQFVRDGAGWAERMVGLDAAGNLAFGLAPNPPPAPPAEQDVGAVLERSPAQEALGAELGALVARQGGAALLIDYGRDAPGFGDTLQALQGHEKVSPLACPGEADLTVHADFPAVLAAARAEGAETSPILTQRDFLLRLGIEARAEALARARPDRAALTARQLDRLIGEDQMGVLFKAACIHAPGLVPPGFEAS